MTRVSPRQVVAFIDRMAPGAMWDQNQPGLHPGFGTQLAALVTLVDNIPPELMPADADLFAELIASAAAIRTQVEAWKANDIGNFGYQAGLGNLHPVGLIRRALAYLPDDLPSSETPILQFIKDDSALRSNLRQDISWAYSALRNREWKAATVLAGSVIEALLLWELKQHPEAMPQVGKGPLDDWLFGSYIKAAKALRCVRQDTITDAEKAQNYRNLIHAGRESRLQETCDLGSAHIAFGALSHVIRDLESQVCPRHQKSKG